MAIRYDAKKESTLLPGIREPVFAAPHLLLLA